jgi:diketogulonate reductase-like aldo/keto reductase
MEQLEDNLGAAGWSLDEKQLQRLDEASEPPTIYPYGMIARSQSRGRAGSRGTPD